MQPQVQRAVGRPGRCPLALLATSGDLVAAVSIRDLDDHVREKLRVRAAAHGRSMEAEIRQILADAVSEPGESRGLLATLLDRIGEVGGVDLDLSARSTTPRSPDMSP